MTRFYKAGAGFFDSLVNPVIPTGAEPESAWSSTWAQLMAGQASGEVIVADTNGLPILQAAPVNLGAYASAKAQAMMAVVNPYTSGSTTLHSDVLPSTLTDWMALQQWATLDPSGTTQWVANDGTVTALPASAVSALAQAIGAYAQAIYQALASALSGIAANTITTTAQVDTALAAA